jgi:hypothetical protein
MKVKAMSDALTKEPVQDVAQVLWDNFKENYPPADPDGTTHHFTTTEIFNLLNNTAPNIITLGEVAPKLLAMGYKMKCIEKPGPFTWCVSFN